MTARRLPPAYKLRGILNDEVHARPPEPLTAPARISYLVMLCDRAQRDESAKMIAEFARFHDVKPPGEGGSHLRVDVGAFRLRWERHSEFVRYTFIVPDAPDGPDPFGATALDAVPADWVAALPGEMLVAAHLLLLPQRAGPHEPPEIADTMFSGTLLVGSSVVDGVANAYTDFRIHQDRFSRFLVHDRSTTPAQAGRIVQQLLEIETYRMLSLLALPVARALAPVLDQQERELSAITAALVNAGEADEPGLLDRLTRLAVAIDSRNAGTQFRFSAAAAYDDLVQRRIRDLREDRIYGVQTFQEFTERRLAPAMATIRATAARQLSLSQQVARATQLLSTRVDITREQQTHTLLEQMNQRVKLQLRLQSTVESLSVAAITYYVVSLIGHAAEGFEAVGIPVRPPIAMAVAIPVVAGLLALGLRRVHHMVAGLE
jgi:uncharacterized membrane-anchored protein